MPRSQASRRRRAFGTTRTRRLTNECPRYFRLRGLEARCDGGASHLGHGLDPVQAVPATSVSRDLDGLVDWLAYLWREQLTEEEQQLVTVGDMNATLAYLAAGLERPINGESVDPDG